MKIRHLLALFIIITNTLINSVWASVHLVAGDHHHFETPHMHALPDLKTLLNFGDNLNESSHGESEDGHFHVLSDLTTQYTITSKLKTNLEIDRPIKAYRTLTYSPPIPPPTHFHKYWF